MNRDDARVAVHKVVAAVRCAHDNDDTPRTVLFERLEDAIVRLFPEGPALLTLWAEMKCPACGATGALIESVDSALFSRHGPGLVGLRWRCGATAKIPATPGGVHG